MSKYELTLAIIKPSLYACSPETSQVLRQIKSKGFEICRSKRIHWHRHEAEAFYAEHKDRFYFPRLALAMTEPFLALALGKENAIADWRALIGPTHVYKAQWQRPETLRAQYGISGEQMSQAGYNNLNYSKTRAMLFMARTRQSQREKSLMQSLRGTLSAFCGGREAEA